MPRGIRHHRASPFPMVLHWHLGVYSDERTGGCYCGTSVIPKMTVSEDGSITRTPETFHFELKDYGALRAAAIACIPDLQFDPRWMEENCEVPVSLRIQGLFVRHKVTVPSRTIERVHLVRAIPDAHAFQTEVLNSLTHAEWGPSLKQYLHDLKCMQEGDPLLHNVNVKLQSVK